MKTLVVLVGICKKIDETSNILKFYADVMIPMSAKVWKCFRCNLVFREESLAELHETLYHHNTTSVDAIEA
jgi:Zn-finger protein